jgi:hypothetical protein
MFLISLGTKYEKVALPTDRQVSYEYSLFYRLCCVPIWFVSNTVLCTSNGKSSLDTCRCVWVRAAAQDPPNGCLNIETFIRDVYPKLLCDFTLLITWRNWKAITLLLSPSVIKGWYAVLDTRGFESHLRNGFSVLSVQIEGLDFGSIYHSRRSVEWSMDWPSEAEASLNNVYKFSPYLTENSTLPLRDQFVYVVCYKTHSYWLLKQVVRIVPTDLHDASAYTHFTHICVFVLLSSVSCKTFWLYVFFRFRKWRICT